MKGLKIVTEIAEKWVEPEIWIRASEQQTIDAVVAKLDTAQQSEKLIVKIKDEILLLKKDEIVYAEVFNKMLTLHTTTHTHTFRQSLTSLKEELSADQFLQISKSAMVNIRKISKLEIAFSGNLYAHLSNGMKVVVSRRFVEELKKRLSI
ncbi:hypothetical protein NRIC_11340 [Enterococcus florum]|uniref:HTH LytTR-type domain-containing protein n=1 Tax=Enterococcus florum TaxID=2480627 RepID=A0A4P5PIQ1_9ENTE|nr:LytTR family DNA-binding domain-containing protein [Enterococcus florum]GCF93243.1 hypothetical protein NRIC_11340 [Enterococcus florum]